jgi:hypothetical protein
VDDWVKWMIMVMAAILILFEIVCLLLMVTLMYQVVMGEPSPVCYEG